MQTEIRDRIDHLLREQGMTQTSIPGMTEHASTRLAESMRGERRFSLSDLATIAAACQVRVEWLHSGEGDPATVSAPVVPAQPVLSLIDVQHLAAILNAANVECPVKWTDDRGETIKEGIARRVGPFDGATQTGAQDMRDMHLHITSPLAERWLLVSSVVDLMREGEFSIRDRP